MTSHQEARDIGSGGETDNGAVLYREALEEIVRGETSFGCVNEPTVRYAESVLYPKNSSGEGYESDGRYPALDAAIARGDVGTTPPPERKLRCGPWDEREDGIHVCRKCGRLDPLDFIDNKERD